jgi:hypothetical protein
VQASDRRVYDTAIIGRRESLQAAQYEGNQVRPVDGNRRRQSNTNREDGGVEVGREDDQ